MYLSFIANQFFFSYLVAFLDNFFPFLDFEIIQSIHREKKINHIKCSVGLLFRKHFLIHRGMQRILAKTISNIIYTVYIDLNSSNNYFNTKSHILMCRMFPKIIFNRSDI